ncbi:hypothetical protein [Natronolimnohabitans innermongolicus]|uniref:Uncharacterized protein n=1 Tax=Natronolimnohabitans innermongolicus JCM 12255 TaxID=1227499 RepID=L9XD99_9EURY|nr:hypothetical protein [Natronolimnohabitans innermongolicus]ELY59602.1 hypothetical protein C493_05035 [Natronolimnohabitans innermongolicus JCM 12255]
MNGLDEISESVYRAIFLGIVFYFALFAYAQFSGDEIALLATEFVFGVIAIGVGAALYLQADAADRSAVAVTGAVALVLGGALQFAYLFTRTLAFDIASSLAVFVGIGCYIYVVWYAT